MSLVAVIKWSWKNFQFASGFHSIEISLNLNGNLLALLDESINVESGISDQWVVSDLSNGRAKSLSNQFINIALSLALLIGNLHLDIFNHKSSKLLTVVHSKGAYALGEASDLLHSLVEGFEHVLGAWILSKDSLHIELGTFNCSLNLGSGLTVASGDGILGLSCKLVQHTRGLLDESGELGVLSLARLLNDGGNFQLELLLVNGDLLLDGS